MFTIDRSSSTAPFEQIIRQVVSTRDSGRLTTGHRLPPVRQLADELDLAPNTVAKAYRELERLGVVHTRGRRGTFINSAEQSMPKVAAGAAEHFVSRMRELSITEPQAIALVRAAYSSDLPG